MNQLQDESYFMKEMMLRKLVFNELDSVSLSRMLEHYKNINYAIGRLDGEKYAKEFYDEQNRISRQVNQKSRITLYTKWQGGSKFHDSSK